MSRWLKKRMSLFDEGAKAFAAAIYRADFDTRFYMCPLCLHRQYMYYRTAVSHEEGLTLEHVPPACVGSSLVMLTCAECNNNSGHKLDHYMLNYEQILRFGEMSLERPVRAQLSVRGETPVRGNITATQQGVNFQAVPKANRRASYEQLRQRFQELRPGTPQSLMEVNVTFELPVDQRLAALGWLRSAYLAAFAAFGYKFIVDRTLASVRRQLTCLDEEIISTFMITIAEADPNTRRLMIVEEPEPYRSLLVQMGRYGVFLPWETSVNLYEFLDLEHKTNPRSRVNYKGGFHPWPSRPQYLMDLPYTR